MKFPIPLENRLGVNVLSVFPSCFGRFSFIHTLFQRYFPWPILQHSLHPFLYILRNAWSIYWDPPYLFPHKVELYLKLFLLLESTKTSSKLVRYIFRNPYVYSKCVIFFQRVNTENISMVFTYAIN